ncbi:MAG: S-layer homology domain-containing protein [Oscillospiraceae bacterium]
MDHYDASNSGTATVTGGKFDADISKYIPTDYVQSADGTVEKLGETNAVAKVGDTYYKTLADAVAAADNNTVTLLKDVTADITIPAGKTMTLDLNGKTLTNVNDHTILNNGNLTITGTGKVDNISHAKGALYNKGTVVVNGGTFDRSKENGKTSNDSGSNSWYTIKNVGSMTIHDGATVQTAGNNTTLGKFSSLVSNGYFNAGDYTNNRGLEQPILTIDGGTFRGGLNTIKNDDHAKLTINGGTFSNYYQAVVQNHNIAEITGGTFTAASDANAKTYGIYNCGCGAEIDLGTLTVSGGTFTGATYAVADVSSENADVTISGGQFAGTKAAIVKSSTSKATIAVSGGKFSSDPSVYVVGNGNTNIVKRDGSEGAYTYTVLAKSGLTSGVYLTNPSGALASNYYVSSTANGVWTVSYSAPYSGGSSSYDPTYSVSTPSKTEHGTVTVSPKNASKGDTVTVTVKPDSGYVLETLTVTDKNGNELTLKDKGNGKYTFTMPAGKVEVKATFMEDNSMLNFFYDVPNNAYFYEAVKWAVKNGITTGVGDNLFAPEQPCTRAQIVTFLWRAAGSPEPKGAASGMTDVVSGSYYEKAVAWAIENGITTGTTTSTFSPDATCTRAQAVTFLARALKAKAASAAEFSDVPTGSYFADAVAWAAANGVTEGIGGGLFGSDNDCTRGQIVTFLYRAYNK